MFTLAITFFLLKDVNNVRMFRMSRNGFSVLISTRYTLMKHNKENVFLQYKRNDVTMLYAFTRSLLAHLSSDYSNCLSPHRAAHAGAGDTSSINSFSQQITSLDTRLLALYLLKQRNPKMILHFISLIGIVFGLFDSDQNYGVDDVHRFNIK